ncbi:hypothetical protein Gotur_021364 [Gossypium turneri]
MLDYLPLLKIYGFYWTNGLKHKIHGKPYLLTPEERQRQIRVERERRGPLNPRRQDDEGSPSTRPKHSPGSSSAAMQSPGLTRAPTQSSDEVIQPMIPTQQPFQMMPVLWQVGAKCPVQLHFLLCRVDRQCIGQRHTRDRKRGCGSSSQVRQPDAVPEEPESPPEEQQPSPKAREIRNSARNRRRPPCGTESPGHRY